MNLRTARAAIFTDVSIPLRGGEYPHVPVGLVQKKGREYTYVRRACAFFEWRTTAICRDFRACCEPADERQG